MYQGLNFLDRFFKKTTRHPEQEEVDLCRAESAVKPIRKGIRKIGYGLETIEDRLDQVLGLLSELKACNLQSGAVPQGPSKEQIDALMSLSDNIFYALKRAGGSDTETLSILQGQIDKALGAFDIQSLSQVHVRFDDRVHEVKEVVSRLDVPDLHVVDVLRPGYLLKDKLLRPAWVVVNRQDVQ